jgi:two-component system CAI-1 autoinducer sensor kinase/phosphatase CqsS
MSFKRVWKNLITFFAEIHDRSILNIVFGKYIALFGHAGYWFLWTYIFPQEYDSAFVRFTAIGLFIPFLFEKFTTNNVTSRAIFGFYFYVCVGYNLPFLFTYLMLMNNFSGMWLICETMAISMTITLIPNVLMFIIVYSIGIIFAYFTFLANSDFNLDLTQTHLEYFLIVPMILAGGSLFNFSAKCGELKAAVEAKSKTLKSLAGTIAHELRNPLNTINLAQTQVKELLASSSKLDFSKDPKGDNEKELINLTSSIGDSVTQANNTINIILADLSNKPIEPSDFSYLSADKILPEIIKTFGYRNLEEKEKVKLNLKDNFIFKAIDDRFTFIIYNLLKNSLYYLNQYPDSVVTVGTEVRMVDKQEYNSIYVHDTGPGIPSEILPKLFGDFFTSGKKDGTGLGLAFCKRNMKIFDGDIIVESETAKDGENGWTKFSLLFPKLSEEEIKAAETEAKKRKILLVDDQQVNLLTTKSRIEQNLANIVCDTASNSKEAINLTKENRYSLILMDIQMPEMNGVTATKEIRKFNKEIPIIAYTSLDQNLEEIKSATNDLIKKPVAENILFRTISKWITDYPDEFSYLGNKEEYKAALQNKNILLADDQQMNLMMTKRSLENYGLKVTAVKDGKELLEIYHSNPHSFDLIITDINMPPCNGDEAAKEIRKTNQIIPIIALSGDGDKKDIHHFFACGMNDYFIKGSNTELLIKIVANYLIEKKDEQIEDQILETQSNEYNNFSNLKILNLNNTNFLDPESKKDIFNLFLTSSHNLLDQIKQNKEINNLKKLLSNVHALKGIAGNIGGEKLFEYIKQIDPPLKRNKLPTDKNWFRHLELLHEELVKEIKLRLRLR